jgi:hypothetical protein
VIQGLVNLELHRWGGSQVNNKSLKIEKD